MLKKRDRIIAGIKKRQTRCLRRSNKFGKELPKAVEQALAWMPRMAIPWGQIQYPKKGRMSEWHLKSYQMGSHYSKINNLCNAIFYLISLWRIADERQGLWQEATLLRHQLLLCMPA